MSSTGNPQFGRKWEITIQTLDGNEITASASAFEPEALKATFDIAQYGFQAFWHADIVIYNLDGPTTQYILKAGDTVTVKAGYQTGVYGQIFKGKLFQPLWERENVNDFKLTLHCILGRDLITNNFVNFSQSAFASQTEVVRRIAAEAFNMPIPVAYLAPNLKTSQDPRGSTYFGSPGKHLDQIAEDNNMQWWIDSNGLNMGSMAQSDGAPALVYTPSTGIVGTPQQTQDGVAFRVLLDSRLQIKFPPMEAKIDNSSIRLAKAQIGQLISILDQDGLYIVGGVRHIGDTRGIEWYTEVIGYTSVGGKLSMLAGAGQQDLSSS